MTETGPAGFRQRSVTEVRADLLERREVALLDVREEGPFALAHPLFAASLPLGRIELEVLDRVPRLTAPIVVYDDGEGLAGRAAARLTALGYSDVALLEGGLSGWRAQGAELFRDVNVPSKAFGELVEARRHTPSIGPEELDAKVRAGANVIVLDARRFEEYQTMSIPSATSVPGGELVLRVRDLAPDPATLVVVNCAGRTRSIIGAQSLVNAGVPNAVAALRNGTIGWTLAGLPLDQGRTRRFGAVSPPMLEASRTAARDIAERAGVRRVDRGTLEAWSNDAARTLYRFDVRTPGEYETGHLRGFRSAPGGQLVQETDVFAPVRGARLVLADDDGVRAHMAASWLAQMGWDAFVLEESTAGDLDRGAFQPQRPPLPDAARIRPEELARLAAGDGATLIDFGPSRQYEAGHVPGAWWVLRSQAEKIPLAAGPERPIVLISPDGDLAAYAAGEVGAITGHRPLVLDGGSAAWAAGGRPLERGPTRQLSPAIDAYQRPYEGTDNPREAMQGYLDWEFGLVAQLERDGSHHFRVV